MKKIVSSLFLLAFLSFVLSSCVTFDGYYYDLEKARSQKKCYQNSDYIKIYPIACVIIWILEVRQSMLFLYRQNH